MKKKWFERLAASKIFWSLLILFIVIRAVTPPLILKELNKFLAGFSPVYAIHIDNLDLGILRGAYRFNGVRGFLKSENKTFFKGDVVDVSLAWRELFHGRVLADVVGDGLEFILIPELKQTTTAAPEKTLADVKTAKKKLFPFHVGRVDIQNSTFQYADLPNLPEVQRWKITDLGGRLTNALPTDHEPISLFNLKGSLLGSSTLLIVGHLNQLAKPMQWDVDVELKEFDLVKANPLLQKRLPLTFTTGRLDIYAEAKSENEKIEGSVKPFLKKVDIVANGEQFSGLKHFGIEIGAATANMILKNAKDNSVATKILFSYDMGQKKFELNSSKAFFDSIAHGFKDKIHPGIENEFKLTNLGTAEKTIK